MAIPTIPGVPSASGFLEAGPDGIRAGFDLALDLCNARPIFVYVTEQKDAAGGGGAPGAWPSAEPPPAGFPAPPAPPAPPHPAPPTAGPQKGGQIWRVFDPVAAVEKLPVWKEWSEEKTYPNGHWKPIYRPPRQEPPPPPVPPIKVKIRTRVFTLQDDPSRSFFKFDEPRPNAAPSTFTQAFNNPAEPAAVLAEVSAELDAPAQQNGTQVPIDQTQMERKVVVFGHADMCAPFSYNFGLSHRRNVAIGMLMSPRVRGAIFNTGRSGGFLPCSDFNPHSGPGPSAATDHERAAEDSPDGVANKPPNAPHRGNPDNRRVELFVLPDYKASSGKPSKIKEIVNTIRGQLMASSGVSASEWPDGEFPCPAGQSSTSEGLFEVCRKLNSQPAPDHQGPGTGRGYRHCKFYTAFTDAIRDLEISTEVEVERPGQPPPPPPENQPQFDHWEWVEDEPVTEMQGEYHPPPGEHYSYYMDKMVREGVNARDIFPPAVAVAPNDRVNPDDFNLVKAGTIRVVKMDIGFWGDERKVDPSRRTGVRREPARYFGLIEGQFAFVCYFESPENAGFVRPCSEGFDSDLTPLCAQLDQAVRQAGFRLLVQAKAVAEDGPDKQRLRILFPDMHLPRKFDERDPVYATDECIRRAQSVKSMVLHQLKRDYRLPAAMTPWLTTLDRRMCRDFFENDAPRLKLPHFYTRGGPRLESRASDEGGVAGAASAVADAARNAFNVLMQVGFRLFTFTQDDYRRMVRKYPENFPEKGYGRTKDVVFNWFYGSTTDKNTAPGREGVLERTAKGLVPEFVQEVLDTHAGTQLEPREGTPPPAAAESLDVIDAGPARDLLRFLRIIEQLQRGGTAIQVFQTGDLYEIWANRRYLFEDFHDPDPDDPSPQLTQLMAGLSKKTSQSGPLGKIGGMAGDALKFLLRSVAKILLGGVNATEHDLWYRRESNKPALETTMDPDVSMLPPEEAYNIDKFDPQLHLPRFTPPRAAPGVVGGGFGPPAGGGPGTLASADGLEYTRFRLGQRPDGTLGPFPATNDRGRAYLRQETQRRIAQVEAFEAPLRTDQAGNQEDRTLLAGNLVGNNRGLWNKAIVDAFRRTNATMIYGNHDCYRGVPRAGGLGSALPFYSEPGLWVEHGHRFEDSNIDGQPFGAFVTNLAYEITELAFAEGLLDELVLHREASQYQPGILQWFLLVQFGGPEFLRRFQRENDNVPRVFPFRISVNSHTHVADLVVAQIVFKDREVAKIDLPFKLPLIGSSISVESAINTGGALLKSILLWKKFEEWYDKWKERNGFDKWWEDIKGNTINWGVDFAGLAKCIDRAINFIKEQGENKGRQLANEFRDSGRSARDTLDQNRRNLGL